MLLTVIGVHVVFYDSLMGACVVEALGHMWTSYSPEIGAAQARTGTQRGLDQYSWLPLPEQLRLAVACKPEFQNECSRLLQVVDYFQLSIKWFRFEKLAKIVGGTSTHLPLLSTVDVHYIRLPATTRATNLHHQEMVRARDFSRGSLTTILMSYLFKLGSPSPVCCCADNHCTCGVPW